MKAVMLYDLAPGAMELARTHLPAHRARLEDFARRGLMFMAGPFADPKDGAMGVFASKEAAEEFMKDDPFLLHGVVAKWRLMKWNETFFSV